MIIKKPMVLDTAYNNYDSDWSRIAENIAAMYCKATEGYYTKDVQFNDTWRQLKTLGIPRAAYHFYRESWYGLPRDPIRQANFFYETVMAQGFIQGDKIVLDAEDNAGMTIKKVLACGREMRRLFNQWPLLYSGYYFLKDMKGFSELSEADIDDLKQMQIIIAGYPFNPDLYDTVPSFYIPNPSKYGKVIGWQYAGDYAGHYFPGVKGSLDFNLFEPDFLTDWKLDYADVPEPPQPPEPPVPPDLSDFTVTNYTTTNYLLKPTTYHVASFDLSKFDLVLDSGFNFMTTDQWALKTGVDYAINGLSGWFVVQTRKGRAGIQLDGAAVYHGKGLLQFNGQNIYIDNQNHFSLIKPSTIWNAYGFPNILIKDGVIQPIRKSLDDIRARTAIGVNKDQTRLYVITVDGKDYWEKEGMNFQQVAQILLDLGCDLAVMSDGGGSTTAIRNINGVLAVVGIPWGEETRVVNGIVYKMRPVAVHFGLKRRV